MLKLAEEVIRFDGDSHQYHPEHSGRSSDRDNDLSGPVYRETGLGKGREIQGVIQEEVEAVCRGRGLPAL